MFFTEQKCRKTNDVYFLSREVMMDISDPLNNKEEFTIVIIVMLKQQRIKAK